MKATEFLEDASMLLTERGKDYDSPQGERSVPATVAAFNAITRHGMKDEEGWLFLLLLKLTRQWTTGKYQHDTARDTVTYAALLAESLSDDYIPESGAVRVPSVPGRK